MKKNVILKATLLVSAIALFTTNLNPSAVLASDLTTQIEIPQGNNLDMPTDMGNPPDGMDMPDKIER